MPGFYDEHVVNRTGSGKYIPLVWDNRHLITFTGGYKLPNNWEVGLRFRYLGRAPYVPVDETAITKSYPIIIHDYDRLGEEQ